MAIGDILRDIGGGLEKGLKVTGEVAKTVLPEVGYALTGEGAELSREKRQRAQRLQDMQTQIKAQALEQALSNPSLTQEQRTAIYGQLDSLVQPMAAQGPSMIQRVHKALHPNATVAQGPQAPTRNAPTAQGGSLAQLLGPIKPQAPNQTVHNLYEQEVAAEMQAGRDPNASPRVKQLAEAIHNEQKEQVEQLKQMYADAVKAALDRNEDPEADEKVQKLEQAIHGIEPGSKSNRDDKAIEIMGKPKGTWTPQEQAYMQGYNEWVRQTKVAPGMARAQVFVSGRELPVMQNGQLGYMNPAEIEAAKKGGTPPVPGSLGAQAMTKEALLEDIRGGSQQVRDSVNAMSDADFSFPNRALIAGALKNNSPSNAMGTLISGAMKDSLNPAQQDYLINLANLMENGMAMRKVLGGGAGAKDIRDAVLAVIPGAGTPSKQYALKQLAVFDKTLDRLERGIPDVPLRNPIVPPVSAAGAWTPPAGAPPAPAQDGQVLRDKATKKAIAVSKGGQWVQPQ